MAQLAPEIVAMLNELDTMVNSFIGAPNVKQDDKNRIQEVRQNIQRDVENHLREKDRMTDDFRGRLTRAVQTIRGDVDKMRKDAERR